MADIQFSAHEVTDYREQNRTLAGLVEYHGMSFTLFGHGEPERSEHGSRVRELFRGAGRETAAGTHV